MSEDIIFVVVKVGDDDDYDGDDVLMDCLLRVNTGKNE